MQNGDGTDDFQYKIGFIPSQHDGGKPDANSGNALISSLFMPFFPKIHRRPIIVKAPLPSNGKKASPVTLGGDHLC